MKGKYRGCEIEASRRIMSTFKEIPNHEERACATCRFYDGRCGNHDSTYWLEKKQEDATCKEHQLPKAEAT